jgi:hypothetical protein
MNIIKIKPQQKENKMEGGLIALGAGLGAGLVTLGAALGIGKITAAAKVTNPAPNPAPNAIKPPSILFSFCYVFILMMFMLHHCHPNKYR